MKKSDIVTFDRVLMAVILVLQLAIIAVLWHTRKTARDDAWSRTETCSREPASAALIVEPWTPQSPRELRDHMDRMMHEALNEFAALDRWMNLDEGWSSLMPSPAMDMREDDHAYVVVLSMPGTSPLDFEVKLHGRLLTVSNRDARPDTRSDLFERSIWLPGPVGDHERPKAVMTNGVLRVVLPKARNSWAQHLDQTVDML